MMLPLLFPVGILALAYARSRVRPMPIIPIEQGCAVGVDAEGVYLKARIRWPK